VYYLERAGIGPVSQLSYSKEFNCIIGIGTRHGYEGQGLATFLLDWFISQLTKEVLVTSFTKKGNMYLIGTIQRLANKYGVDIIQYDYETGEQVNLRYSKPRIG
jgi:hypothetical protein